MQKAMCLNKNMKNNLYNRDRKEEFLDDMVELGLIQERTAASYARIFEKTQKFEEKIDKDLSEFTFKQLERILHSFESNNRNTIESYARIISSYLNWNVKQGYINKNMLIDMKPNDFQKYLTNDEFYLTEREIRRYEDDCENAQDAVILRLIFEGLTGKELSEVRNLKKTDVDYDNNTLYIAGSKPDNGRTVRVSQYTMDLIRQASQQKTYKKKNGNMKSDGNGHVRDFTDLVDNDYVVRASITKNNDLFSPVDKFVIYRRLEAAGERVDKKLTAKFIERSGQIYYAQRIMEGDELTVQDLKDVAKRFNMSSYHNLKGYLTTENVKKTYSNKRDIERINSQI